MRRIALCSITLAAAVAVPTAQAKTDKPSKPDKPVAAKGAKSAKCTPRAVGYKARGTLVSSALTQSAGADTAKRGDDRYSGTVEVDVAKANHRAPKGPQSFTVTDARVKFYDADRDGTADVPKAGDRVKLHGKITRLAKKCDQSAFTPTVTVRKIGFKQAKAPESTPAP